MNAASSRPFDTLSAFALSPDYASPSSSSRTRCSQWHRLRWTALALIIALSAGCSTTPAVRESSQLHPIPEVPSGHLRADRAILTAFLAAYGIPLSHTEAAEIIPEQAPPGEMDRQALQRVVRAHRHVLRVVKADERYLWRDLEENRPVLIRLPLDTTYRAAANAYMPVSWDRSRGSIALLDGNGDIHTLPEADFFARRAPLRHAALILTRSSWPRAYAPPREQTLLLADFWYNSAFYPPPSSAIPVPVLATSVAEADALAKQGTDLIRRRQHTQAIPFFQAALPADPDNPAILNHLAYCKLHGGGQLLIALRHATKAAQLDPGNPLIHDTLGRINLRLGDAPRAVRNLNYAWALAQRHPPEIQVAIMDELVRAWLGCHRVDRAREIAEYRHRSFPDYRMPRDILLYFPGLGRPPSVLYGNLPTISSLQ